MMMFKYEILLMTDHLLSPAHLTQNVHGFGEFSRVDARVRRHCMLYASAIFFVWKKNASCGKTDKFDNQTRHIRIYGPIYRFCEQGWTPRRALYF